MRWIMIFVALIVSIASAEPTAFRTVSRPATRAPYSIAEIIKQASIVKTCSQAPNKAIKLVSAAQTSRRMQQLFDADQADRQGDLSKLGQNEINKLIAQDLARRQETLEYILRDRLSTDADFLGAGFIFQHGNCSDSYLLAHQLAGYAIALSESTVSRGEQKELSRWLYAATFDRYLRSQNKPQKFGTQYIVTSCAALQEFDPATSDAERAQYSVPTLEQAKARVAEFGTPCK
jgi:hypothetical protein